ncbi:MAG: nucleotidyltransferase family protein [Bdellovibrionales bacterium]|nr:nucleotidyltransferase family protein [Bdellovibrionales bacterium]
MKTWKLEDTILQKLVASNFSKLAFHIDRTNDDIEARILKLARRHRVTNLLPCSSFFNQDSLATIAQSKTIMTQRQLQVLGILKALLPKLEEAELPYAVVKGSDLAFRFYAHPAERIYSDIDLLIDLQNFERYEYIFNQCGYQLRKQPSNSQGGEFYAPQFGVIIDTDSIGNFKPERYEMPHGQLSYFGLPPVQLLIYLSEHGAKHAWCRLQWIYDIALLLQSMKDSELQDSLARSQGQGSSHKVRVAISLATYLFPVDSEPMLRLPFLQALCTRFLLRRLFVMENPLRMAPITLFVRAGLEDSWYARLKLLGRKFFSPTDRDYQFLKLPHTLNVFYPMVRPVRIFRQLMTNRNAT